MRITEKGQVTIPKAIRDKLGVGPGSEVAFVERGAEVHVVGLPMSEAERERMRRDDMQNWLASVRATGERGLSTEEVMEVMRGPFDDLDPR